jgi:hypothetical protein
MSELRSVSRPWDRKIQKEMTMLKRTFIKTLAGSILAGAAAPVASAQKATKSGYADVNGLKYYYAITGKGEPLLILHGGLGSIDMFDPLLPLLTEHREVIAVDLHGHGRTALGTRDFSLINQGADMAILLKGLGYGPVDVMGYSMGGGVAFQLAWFPRDMRRMVFIRKCCRCRLRSVPGWLR